MIRRPLVLVVLLTACADLSSSESSDDRAQPGAPRGSLPAANEAADESSAPAGDRTGVDPNVAVMHTDDGDIFFHYEYGDGRVPIAEGDLIIPYQPSETRSAVTAWTYRKWTNAVVPYVVSDDLPDSVRVTDAIAHWEAKTKVRFVARTTERDFVEFRSATGCASHIGRIGNKQYVDLSTGERGTNVVAVAIDPSNDRVHYYFARGFKTAGNATRADAFEPHRRYALPAGKTPADLVDVAGGPGGKVVAWYKDGTFSEGTFANLAATSSGGTATLPAGRTWANVHGIAIDAQSQVHAFYRDGTKSIGTAADLGSIAAPAPFSLAAGKTAAQLAGVEIAKSGAVLQFYSNGDTWDGAAAARVSFPGHCGTGTTIHEIGHAVGVHHEQTRVDRDDHVVVNYANIQSGKSYNFDKHSVSSAADHGTYDLLSIMHYDSYAFSSNGKPTITKKDGTTFSANRDALSAGDIAGVATLYP